MQIVKLLFGGLLAHRLISVIVTLIIAGVIFMMATDANFMTSAASKIGDLLSGESGGIVDWITDYITKVIDLFRANMN